MAPLSPHARIADIVHAQHWIAGATCAESLDSPRPITDPATGVATGDFTMGSAALVDQAVLAAANAGPSWWALSAQARAQLLIQVADRLAAAAPELAVLE